LNRSEPTGYKVVRVPFKDGKPEGSYENFAVGFWTSGTHRAEVLGPPRSACNRERRLAPRRGRRRWHDLAHSLYGAAESNRGEE
jgi:hypothetical protein